MVDVLFICIHNSGRSQMAEAFFNTLAGGKFCAASAGTQPADSLNPAVVRVMSEAGVDMSACSPKSLIPEMLKSAGVIITMGCGKDAACPLYFTPAEDWGLPDPEGMPLKQVRQLRDDIKAKVAKLISRLNRNLTNA